MQETRRVGVAGPAVSLEVHDDDTVIRCAQSADTCYVVSVPERRVLYEIKVRDGGGPRPALLLDQTAAKASARKATHSHATRVPLTPKPLSATRSN